jgi:hypothetical protein
MLARASSRESSRSVVEFGAWDIERGEVGVRRGLKGIEGSKMQLACPISIARSGRESDGVVVPVLPYQRRSTSAVQALKSTR